MSDKKKPNPLRQIFEKIKVGKDTLVSVELSKRAGSPLKVKGFHK